MKIRMADVADAPGLLAVYAPYVLHTPVTFEYEIPSEKEFARRIGETLKRYPYLIAEEGGQPVGYAYASAFKSRAAYDWSVENSIYIEEGRHGQGIGRLLYGTLEKCLAEQNICNLCACIAYPNPSSIAFHEKTGYRTVAHFTSAGYKGGKWYDIVWMEKQLTPHQVPPKPFIPCPKTKAAGGLLSRSGKDCL